MLPHAFRRDKEAGPLLVANVGNTHLRLVGFEGEAIAWERRFASGNPAEWALPDLSGQTPVVVVSVVPDAADRLIAHWGRERVQLLSAATAGLPVRYEPPTAIGADRLANALAVRHRWGWGIAVDLGTATTFTVVDATGAVVGGSIMPGLATARDSLAKGTALLPEAALEAPDGPWGTSTLGSLQTGLVHGHVGAVVHLVDRMRAALPAGAPVVLTGGWSRFFAPLLPDDFQLEPDLTIWGGVVAHDGAAASPPRS